MRIYVGTLCFGLLLLALISQGYAADSSADFEQLSCLELIDSNSTNLVVVSDVRPTLKSLLEWEQVNFDRPKHPDSSLDWLEKNAYCFPSEVIVAMSPDSLGRVGELLRILVLFVIGGAAEVGEELDLVNRELEKALQAWTPPNATLCAKFDSERYPNHAFATSALMIPMLRMRGIEVTCKPNRLAFKASVGDFVQPETVTELLAVYGATAAADPKVAGSLAKKLTDLEFEARLERFGSFLRLSFGPIPEEGRPMKESDLSQELWQPGPERLLYAQWRIDSFEERVLASIDLLEHWSGKGVRTFVADTDMNTTLRNLLYFNGSVQWGRQGEARIAIDHLLNISFVKRGQTEVSPLTETGLQKLTPAQTAFVSMSSAWSASDFLERQYLAAEDRMYKSWLKKKMSGQTTPDVRDWIVEWYETHLVEIPQFLANGRHEAFQPPFALLIDQKGKLSSWEVNCKLTRENAPPELSAGRFTIIDSPIVEVAMIAKAKRTADANRFYADLWRLFAEGVNECQLHSEAESPVDWGFEAPTHLLNGSLWSNSPASEWCSLNVDGDFEPHTVHIADWVVFSTSRRLTRSILDAYRNSEPAVEVRDATVVEFGRVSAEFVGDYFDSWEQMFRELLDTEGASKLEGFLELVDLEGSEFSNTQASIARRLSKGVRCFEGIEWTTRETEAGRRTDYTAPFASRPAPAAGTKAADPAR